MPDLKGYLSGLIGGVAATWLVYEIQRGRDIEEGAIWMLLVFLWCFLFLAIANLSREIIKGIESNL